jgi:hypothetical protein
MTNHYVNFNEPFSLLLIAEKDYWCLLNDGEPWHVDKLILDDIDKKAWHIDYEG